LDTGCGVSDLELEPAGLRESDIKDQAAGKIEPRAVQKCLDRLECLHLVANRAEQILNGFSDVEIVIDDEDNGLVLSHRIVSVLGASD
jgi:hypothetical protein